MVRRKNTPKHKVQLCMGRSGSEGSRHSPYDTPARSMPSRRDRSSHRSVTGVYDDMSPDQSRVKEGVVLRTDAEA